MKRFLCCTCFVLLFVTAVGCNREADAEEYTTITTPDEYCAEFDDADLIVDDDGNFYVEATHISWVEQLDLNDATPLGEVKRTGIMAQFEPWDATVLPAGTAIAQHNSEKDVLIAVRDGKSVPYLLYKSE